MPGLVFPTSSLTWDPAILGTPLLDGYAQRQLGGTVRSKEVMAEPYFKIAGKRRSIDLSLGFEQTSAQYQAFADTATGFWYVDLLSGLRWFNIDLAQGPSPEIFVVHATSWRISPVIGNVSQFVRLSMDLEAMLPVPFS